MIGVGVNEPVFFEKAEKNDKNTLSITFREATGEEKKKLSLMDQMNEGSDTSGNNDLSATNFLLFAPSTEFNENGTKKPVEGAKRVENLINFKNQLVHILKRYTTTKNIKFNVLKGLVLKTEDELITKVMDEKNYLLIYTNIVDQFLEQCKTFNVFDPLKQSRLLLVRQSAEKHFGRLRDKFLENQPFLEDIAIPKDKSQLYIKAGTAGATTLFEADADGYVPKFTDYEIKNGKDNPIRSATEADRPDATPEDAAAVEGLFGKPTEEAIDFSATPVEEPGTDIAATEE
jgi:hypothetical protein